MKGEDLLTLQLSRRDWYVLCAIVARGDFRERPRMRAAIEPVDTNTWRERRLEAALIGLREFVVDRGEIFDGGADGYEAQALVEAADEALSREVKSA
jgi:hypothetical protein